MRVFFFLLCLPLHVHAVVDADGLEWEDPVPELIEPEAPDFDPVNRDDDAQFSEDLPPAERVAAGRELRKKKTDQLVSSACEQIIAVKEKFPRQSISRTTQYFLPLFSAGKDGGLQLQDRRSCIQIEGSCVVEQYLYNWNGESPWGQRWLRRKVPFRFGKGSGQSYYNTTNALDPCRTVAADSDHYPTGSVIYIPSMRGKLCPQNLKPVDGCFIVGDVGSAIRGAGRFDLFVGECLEYDKASSSCRDPGMSSFSARPGAEFYLVRKHNMFAKYLREEADLMIRSDWRNGLLP